MAPRIMYIEDKSGGLSGPARIGRVTYSRTGATLYYRGRAFQSLGGQGFKANYREVDTDAEFWISGPKRNGQDHLYGGSTAIDDDVREEYWTQIRKRPDQRNVRSAGRASKYRY